MEDWSVTALNTADLKPKKRLDLLFEKAATTHVDSSVDIRRYFQISIGLLNSARKLRKKGKHEIALLSFLRYQAMIKKLKTHARYRDLPMGERAAFDYKLKDVAKNVKELTDIVHAEYKRFYNITDFSLQNQDIEGYQEQRPTVSTVRTFVSLPLPRDPDSDPPSVQKISSSIRGRYRCVSEPRTSSSVNMSMMKSFTSTAETFYGIRRSIFPTRQVREFDEIHKQRKTVRGLRTVIIPSQITTVFSYISFKNTGNNIETVGYLAGREIDANELVVSHLIIPEQLGFSDYFKIIESSRLIRYLDNNDLLTIGWIHSHPVETPYLSSGDMHYQSVFQSVLPEAIAMVYSPKEMKSTPFNLTPNHGLKLILNCRKKGFHTHPTNPPLTMQSQHAVIDLYGDVTIRDFRPNAKKWNAFEAFSQERLSSFGYPDLFERMLYGKTSTNRLTSMSKIRQSEVTFVHLNK